MDKATEIARQINYMCFSGFEKSEFDQECCANIIRQHLVPEKDLMFPATFTGFEISDDEKTVLLTYKAKMKDIVPLKMALGFDYTLTVKPEAPEALLTAPNQYMDLCDDSLPEASQ